MKAKQILIIDDELWTVESTIDRINRVFGDETVVYCDDVIDGLNKIIENEYACIILDVMFPLPDMGNEQNRAVLLKEFEPLHSVEMTPVNTGIVVLHNIRNVLDVTVPVICFTIRKDESLIEQISKYKKTIHIHKLDEKAFELLINELKNIDSMSITQPLLQIVEYSMIPIGLFGYSACVRKLANPDPVSSYPERKYKATEYLEYILIIGVSVMLYGMSQFGHPSTPYTFQIFSSACVVALGIFVVLFYLTSYVRAKGDNNARAIWIVKSVAASSWVCLSLLILIWYYYIHDKEFQIKNDITNLTTISLSTLSIWGFGFVSLSLLMIMLWQNRIKALKRQAIKEYNKGISQLQKNHEEDALTLLNISLSKIPPDSALNLEIYMKKFRLYFNRGDYSDALAQIETLQQLAVYTNMHATDMKDGILREKARVLRKLGELEKCKEIIASIANPDIRSKLKSEVYDG